MPNSSTDSSNAGPRAAPKWVRLTLLFVLYVVVGSCVTDAQMSRWGLGWFNEPSAFNRLLDRSADRPYVYRALIPTAINVSARILPEPVKAALAKPLGEQQRSLLKRALDRYARGETDPLRHFLGYGFVLVSAIGICWVWRALLLDRAFPRELPRPSAALVDTLPALAVLLIPLSFARGGYLYDLPQILLVSLLFWCFLARRFRWYYVLFVIAMFNKESSLLMAAWFLPALFRRDSKSASETSSLHLEASSASRHLLMHVLLGAPILAWLYWFYGDRAGGPVEWHLVDNLRSYFQPSTYAHMVDIYSAGIPLPQGFNIVNLLFFGFLFFYAWKLKSSLLRSLFVASVIVVFPLFLAFGYRDEVRVFDLAFPAAFLLATDTLMRLWKESDSEG